MTRLRHRIPVSLRQNWKLLVAGAAFLGVCWGVFGGGMVRPYAVSVSSTSADTVTQDVTGTKDLFDTSVPHEITLTFRDESYQDMLAEYAKDGEKKYVEADLTIDGTTVPSVGIRLKGNSTLRGLTWQGQRVTQGRGVPGGERPEGPPGGRARPEGRQPPDGFNPPEGFQPPDGFRPPGEADQQTGDQQDGRQGRRRGGPGGPGGFGGLGAELKAEEPESLPWLISFDEFVDGRRYQGHSQIAVRPVTGQSSAMLNEALAIATVGAAGEPTQSYTYSAFTVNGRASAPRLVVEYLDEGYAADLGDGVLYKSLATGSFTYKGEDQTRYGDDFKQVNQVGGTDLQPVINLVRWVNETSDEEFAAGLSARLDVESFARYAALQHLMLNFDDMSGPGRNYYLWYDLGTRRFRVITWDLNFAYNGDASTGPHDSVGGFGGGMMGGHKLKERFLETPAFKKLYEEQYAALYRELLAGGTLTGLLGALVRSYELNDGAAPVDSEAERLRTLLTERARALSADEVITR
ncbi:CotH kinase family protein [Nonomuraea sp. MCN248]|uniref:CotH kinase family protein n=1 Tax=Nonomuraea corallina TaxID=2989783 RepID=A0ABT4SEW7_9ACTN|nr:CotH kinase family protein [Nonomuraea corallina]MDA0635520.1 CotH kinase family protein [Nonomuraea corallina]